MIDRKLTPHSPPLWALPLIMAALTASLAACSGSITWDVRPATGAAQLEEAP